MHSIVVVSFFVHNRHSGGGGIISLPILNFIDGDLGLDFLVLIIVVCFVKPVEELGDGLERDTLALLFGGIVAFGPGIKSVF